MTRPLPRRPVPTGKTCGARGPDRIRCERERGHPVAGWDGFHAAYDGEDLVRW